MKKHLFALLFLAGLVMLSNWLLAQADETYHWGFKISENNIPPSAGEKYDQLLNKHHAIYKGNPNKKTIYLTFDNGYENGFTESILETLKKEQVPATFFLTGHYLTSATPLVKTMLDDGHMIGNHSFNHPNMATLSPEEMQKEWDLFDTKLKELTGVPGTKYVRPPEGTFNETLLKTANTSGYRHIFWSIAYKDWDTKSTISEEKTPLLCPALLKRQRSLAIHSPHLII